MTNHVVDFRNKDREVFKYGFQHAAFRYSQREMKHNYTGTIYWFDRSTDGAHDCIHYKLPWKRTYEVICSQNRQSGIYNKSLTWNLKILLEEVENQLSYRFYESLKGDDYIKPLYSRYYRLFRLNLPDEPFTVFRRLINCGKKHGFLTRLSNFRYRKGYRYGYCWVASPKVFEKRE